ncbi:hypothetical protein BGX30_008832 [Mortierella sp. GBA39]|nr:hypothetical protein BGX30_008832 [Mortierella sp. GBA39]
MAEQSTTTDQALCYKNNNNDDALPQRRNTSPLEIPELLDKIFSYVDETTLGLSVISVCRHWFQVGRGRVVREAVYDTNMTDEELEGVIMKQLPVARRLYWFTHLMSGKEATRRLPQRAKVAEALEVKHRLWEKVLAGKEDKVDDDKYCTSDDNRKQEQEQEQEEVKGDRMRLLFPATSLQELILAGKFMGFDSQLVHLLPFLSHLTVLRMETDLDCGIRLNTVFRACPYLQEVALRPKSSLWNPDPFLESDDDIDPEAWSEFSVVGDGGGGGERLLVHLRVFVLECYYVRLRTLLDFLSAAPRLEDLQIVRLRASVADDEDLSDLEVHYEDEEETTEYLLVKAAEILETLCRHLEGTYNSALPQPQSLPLPLLLLPMLKNLHLSVETLNLEVKNPQRLLKLCPALQSSVSTDYLGLRDEFYKSLQQRIQIAPAPQNVITTLDLRAISGRGPSLFLGDELHYYLCESPHLLHLLAPWVQMRVNQMDVWRRLVRTRVCETLTFKGIVKPRPGIWACSKLQTLHMSFSLFASNSWTTIIKREAEEDGDDDRTFRILYGYLSVVCPALVDLYLNLEPLQNHSSFFLASRHLALKMGFILLTRLEGLERLMFHGPSKGFRNETRTVPLVDVLKDIEIDWMVAGSSPEETGMFNSEERNVAWREFYDSQMWERLLQREREIDGPMRERHRQVMEDIYAEMVNAAAVAAAVSQRDKNKDQQWETRKEAVDIRYREPKKCAHSEEMMTKLENLGLLLDVKLMLDQVLRKRGVSDATLTVPDLLEE